MAAQLGVSLVVEPLDGRLLDGVVHALDLAVGPGVLRLGEAMIDVVAGAGDFEGMGPEWLLPLDHGFDCASSAPIIHCAVQYPEREVPMGEWRKDAGSLRVLLPLSASVAALLAVSAGPVAQVAEIDSYDKAVSSVSEEGALAFIRDFGCPYQELHPHE